MNLVADPILTPTEDEKDANRCQRTTRKREKTVLIESRLETSGGYPSIEHTHSPVSEVLCKPTLTLFVKKPFLFWREKIFEN